MTVLAIFEYLIAFQPLNFISLNKLKHLPSEALGLGQSLLEFSDGLEWPERTGRDMHAAIKWQYALYLAKLMAGLVAALPFCGSISALLPTIFG